MEQTMIHLAHAAVWTFFIVFLFAVIGIVATVRWIVAQVTRGATAVGTGVGHAEDAVFHRNRDNP